MIKQVSLHKKYFLNDSFAGALLRFTEMPVAIKKLRQGVPGSLTKQLIS
jgi:hypothetical protein